MNSDNTKKGDYREVTLGEAAETLDRIGKEILNESGVVAIGVALRNHELHFVVSVRDPSVLHELKRRLPSFIQELPLLFEISGGSDRES